MEEQKEFIKTAEDFFRRFRLRGAGDMKNS